VIRITGRSTYTDYVPAGNGSRTIFVLSALLDTRDWEKRANDLDFVRPTDRAARRLDKTQRRLSFAQLTGSAEYSGSPSEARALKRAEKPLDRVQQEVPQRK